VLAETDRTLDTTSMKAALAIVQDQHADVAPVCVCQCLVRKSMQNFRGGHLRPQIGVFLKCELRMVAKTGNNQTQFPEVALALDC